MRACERACQTIVRYLIGVRYIKYMHEPKPLKSATAVETNAGAGKAKKFSTGQSNGPNRCFGNIQRKKTRLADVVRGRDREPFAQNLNGFRRAWRLGFGKISQLVAIRLESEETLLGILNGDQLEPALDEFNLRTRVKGSLTYGFVCRAAGSTTKKKPASQQGITPEHSNFIHSVYCPSP